MDNKKTIALLLCLLLYACAQNGCSDGPRPEYRNVTMVNAWVQNRGIVKGIKLTPDASLNCNVCNKNMYNHELNIQIIGVEIVVPHHEMENRTLRELYRKFYQEQFGPYEFKNYRLCWECWLRSLGIHEDME